MLIGAGMAAQMVTKEIKRLRSSYEAVGCVDGDFRQRGGGRRVVLIPNRP